jgi:excisionase family DNA binding protein
VNAGIGRHLDADGCVIVPPRVALFLWNLVKIKLPLEKRHLIRDADPAAFLALMALRYAAEQFTNRSDSGTKAVVEQLDPPALKAWLTTTETAEALGISDRAVRKQITSGRLAATKHGQRCWLVNRNDLPISKR